MRQTNNMDKWKDEIIDSLKDIKRAEPPEGTFLKIQEKIIEQKTDGRRWIAIAASIVLAIGANLYFIINYHTEQAVSQSKDYSSMVSNYNLYE